VFLPGSELAGDHIFHQLSWSSGRVVSRFAHAFAARRCRGIGFAHYIELNTGDPRERAEITVRPESRISVVLGTLSTGQGHETSFPQLIAEWFGVEHGNVKLITGDTDLMPVGGGTASGRSMRLGAVVMAKASDQIVEKGPAHRCVAPRGRGSGHRSRAARSP
jgi:carbon-monoxide dehydrogenase large subunit